MRLYELSDRGMSHRAEELNDEAKAIVGCLSHTVHHAYKA